MINTHSISLLQSQHSFSSLHFPIPLIYGDFFRSLSLSTRNIWCIYVWNINKDGKKAKLE